MAGEDDRVWLQQFAADRAHQDLTGPDQSFPIVGRTAIICEFYEARHARLGSPSRRCEMADVIAYHLTIIENRITESVGEFVDVLATNRLHQPHPQQLRIDSVRGVEKTSLALADEY